MAKPTGFLEYERETGRVREPKERLRDFKEFHIPLAHDKQRVQAARCMDCGVPFCQAGMLIKGMVSGCPLNNLIPEWNDLLWSGNWKMAYDRLMITHSFPEFTCRVCPAPCEAACTSNLNGLPTSIKEDEWSIIETAYENGYAAPKPPSVRTGKKVAVIGSGPAGLAAADQLNKRGHSVTVYERRDRVGGLLRYGIPNMKLDKRIIDRKIGVMQAEGVEFIANADVGNDYDAKKIMEDYDCVILACGAANPRDLNVPGRGASGIYFAVDFLTGVTKSLLDSNFKDGEFINAKGKNVMIIGGGDTGNDCTGTSLRLGCKSLIALEMMPKPPVARAEDNPWPEWPKTLKVDYGQEEAIEVFGKDPRVYQTTVKEFIADKKGNLKKAVIVHLEPHTDEKSGRMSMVEVEGTEKTVPVDICLIAAGFLGCQDYVAKAFGVDLDARTNVATKAGSYKTNVPNVFTCGDMHRGQSLVVWAIREGREAAREVDAAMMGYTNLD